MCPQKLALDASWMNKRLDVWRHLKPSQLALSYVAGAFAEQPGLTMALDVCWLKKRPGVWHQLKPSQLALSRAAIAEQPGVTMVQLWRVQQMGSVAAAVGMRLQALEQQTLFGQCWEA